MSSLFGILNIGTKGLFAQQTSIDVTSHNISNANTDGYSRQTATLQESRPQSVIGSAGQLGTGVDVSAVNRIRNTFIDSQVRMQTSISGQFTSRDNILNQIQSAMNEPTDTGISTALGSFFDTWNTLATASGDPGARTMVVQQSVTLANQLNQTSAKLQNLKSNSQGEIQSVVYNINSMLNTLSSLNQQIKQVSGLGNAPNDLMDQRDLLLDKLSNEFGISVSNKGGNGIDVTSSSNSQYADVGDNGNAPLQADGKTPFNIVQTANPNATAKFSYINDIEPASGQQAGQAGKYTVTYYKNGDVTTDNNKVTMTVDIEDTGTPGSANYVSAADKFNQLNECRVLWSDNTGAAMQVDKSTNPNGIYTGVIPTDGTGSISFDQLALFKAPSGELKGYMSVQSDIDTYQNQLNGVAKALAFAVNGIISQSSTWKPDNPTDGSEGGINNFFVNSNPATAGTYTAADETNITAANISVNQAIINAPMKIKTASQYDSSGNMLPGEESDGNRALAMEMLRNNLMSIQNVNSSTTQDQFLSSILKPNSNANNLLAISNDPNGMTIGDYFKNSIDALGVRAQDAKNKVTTQTNALSQLNQMKESTSGVSLDEEMANLVQYQHCYQANAKVISTVDQLLDVVVNDLKR